jgi:hypothetical protein
MATENMAAEDLIVCNLMQALTRLHDDLDRVEIWTAALGCFLRPVPDYKPGDDYLLPTPSRRRGRLERS